MKDGCCFKGLRNQPKSQNAIKTNGISTIGWLKLSVGIKNVEISRDQLHFSNCMFLHKWSFKRKAQKVQNRDFKNDAISLDRVQVLHFSGSFWASQIEEVALCLTK